MTIIRREIGAPVEGLEVGRQEDAHRPPAAAGQRLDGRHAVAQGGLDTAALKLKHQAMKEDDAPERWFFYVGQSAGLIDDVAPAGEIVLRIVAEAEEVLRARLPELLA